MYHIHICIYAYLHMYRCLCTFTCKGPMPAEGLTLTPGLPQAPGQQGTRLARSPQGNETNPRFPSCATAT